MSVAATGRSSLLQVVTNLVHNAIVHNLPSGGTVRVTTSSSPRAVALTVENTGETITPELAARLTEPFQRGTGRLRTDHAGVGLGLAIVKTITRAHDGTLTVAPRPDGGLRVTVRLPAGGHTPAVTRPRSAKLPPMPEMSQAGAGRLVGGAHHARGSSGSSGSHRAG